MSTLKNLILTGAIGLATIVSGCGPRNAVNNAVAQGELKKDQRYTKGMDNLLAEFGDVETLTTKITNIQDGFIPIEHYSCAYKLVKISGGDVSNTGLVLIYPHSKYFEPYVPVKISFKRIKNGKISTNEFIKRYLSRVHYFDLDFNYVIEADGVIEPDGVEYLEEKK